MQENFSYHDGSIRRSLALNSVETTYLQLTVPAVPPGTNLSGIWDKCVLQGAQPSLVGPKQRPRARILDLFSGCGGLGYGVARGLRTAGFNPVIEMAADLDDEALQIYERNLAPHALVNHDIDELVDRNIGTKRGNAYFSASPWIKDRRLASRLHGVDILVGGPPCQGHSNLNNHTRRADSRNELYLTMPAMAIALDIPIVIIENVREVQSDYFKVVEQTRDLLLAAGYAIAEGVLSALDLGLPQTRNRFFLIAVKRPLGDQVCLPISTLQTIRREPRDLRWAIGDLEKKEFGGIHRASNLSAENVRRINWLFDNDEHDLPDRERPDCHKNGHTYGAVYGRLKWGNPAGTITTGFMTPGRGRYIHPSQRRALTPQEAARIQGFPDSFRFEFPDGTVPSNKTLGKVIGDAVPPVMGEEAILAALQLRSADSESLLKLQAK